MTTELTDKEVIKQYRYLFEQISTLSEPPVDTKVCLTHLIAIHKICEEALGMDGA